MSTGYFIHCEACNESLRFEATRYEIPLLLTIIRHAYNIPAIADFIADAHGDVTLAVGEHRRLDPSWFGRHRGAHHPLVVIDEYGRIDGRCGEHYTCERCATSHYCNLPKGHPPATPHAGRIT